MAHVRVYLGWALLLETGASGLAAVRELARALEVPADWDRERSCLYLASPLRGLSLVVQAEATREPVPAARAPTGAAAPAEPAADGAESRGVGAAPAADGADCSAAARALARGLAGAGARVRETVAGDDPPAATLVLAPGREEAAVIRHPGLFSRQSRDLAACLLESLRLSGLPAAAGPRPELTGEPAAHGPGVRILVPRDWLASPTRVALLTDALVQGLLRYFCPPDLDRTIHRWAHLPPAPEVLPEPESGRPPRDPAGPVPPRPPEPEGRAEATAAPPPPAEPEGPAEPENPEKPEEPEGLAEPAEPEEPDGPEAPAEPDTPAEPPEPPHAPPPAAAPPEGIVAAPVRLRPTVIRRAAPRPLPPAGATAAGIRWPWQVPGTAATAVPRYPFRLPLRPVPVRPGAEPPDTPAAAAPDPDAPVLATPAPGTPPPAAPAPGTPAADALTPGVPADRGPAPDAPTPDAPASGAPVLPPAPLLDSGGSGPAAPGPAPFPTSLPPLAGGEPTPLPSQPRRRRTYPHWIRSWE